MKIVPATVEEFRDLQGHGTPKGEGKLQLLIKGIPVAGVVRLVEHEHNVNKEGRVCYLTRSLSQAARSIGAKISVRHNGADLLVRRLK